MASNPYLDTDAAGWVAGPFTPAWTWAGGKVSGGTHLVRSSSAPVPRTASALYRLRVQFTTSVVTNVFWGIYLGTTPTAASQGPYWMPADATWLWDARSALAPGSYTFESTWDPALVDPRYTYLGPFVSFAANLLDPESSSFEGGTTGNWNGSDTEVANSTVRASVGTHSLLVTWPTLPADGTQAGYGVRSRLTVGRTYTATARVWVAPGSPPVRLAFVQNLYPFYGAQSTTTGAWETLTVTFTAIATNLNLILRAVGATTAGQQVWMDDVRVVDTAGLAATSVSTIELTAQGDAGVDLSCLVDSVSINHGRGDSTAQPEASSATIELTSDPVASLPPEVDVGAVVVVSTATARGVSQRFVGRVTDLSLGWEDAGPDTPDAGVGQLVAVGMLADLGRRVVGDTPFPQELDGARVARVMAAAGVALDPLTSDPGTAELLARDVDSQAALDVAQSAATSAGGILWQTRGGQVRYADADHRRGTSATLALDACDVLVTPTWRRNIDGLINAVSLGYGVAPEGGEQPRFIAEDTTSQTRWGTFDYTTTTELATLTDAQNIGRVLLARNSEPVWIMAALPIDVESLDADRYEALLALEMHALVNLTGLPSLGTAPTSATLWVEGWHETLTYGSHGIELVVSGYCRTAPPPRWDDLDPTWLWDELQPDLTWDDAACLGPPTNLGRWNDQPATLRWDQVPPAKSWDTFTT